MRNLLILVLLAWGNNYVFSQNTFNATILDKNTKEPLIGTVASIQGTTLGGMADNKGHLTISNIPDGKQVIVFSLIGYEALKDTLTFPLSDQKEYEALLIPSQEELEEVIISSTRSSRIIADIPTRVEVISGEELDEKATMKPGDIRMQLNESTGIQVQQTSATSANANIKIQGLDGRYTQILKDGFPLYSGLSSGLGIMQIPPLDLKQVEIIKGSASTLYGGGAIAGIVNLISKEPTKERELSFLSNVTSAKGLDLSAFYGQRFKKVGTTIFAASNSQIAYDANKDDLSDLPQTQRYTLNPKLYYYFNDSTTFSFGLNTSTERRTGGDMHVIKGDGDIIHSYFEKNLSDRLSSQAEFDKQLSKGQKLRFKNSLSYFNRDISIPNYSFKGTQYGSFTEIDYMKSAEKTDWIIGLNMWIDRFKEKEKPLTGSRDYNYLTYGGFIQNNWKATEKFSVESGVRTDYQNEYGLFVLPRVSLLYKLNKALTSRLGGGLGYKTPTVFLQEAEQVAFQKVLHIDVSSTKAETSIGGNFDLNYKTSLFGVISLSINQMFFYTKLDDALILNGDSLVRSVYKFQNASGHIDTKGFETNIKLTYNELKLFIGYTYLNTKRHYNNLNNQIPLTPQNRLGCVLMYEKEDKFRIGYEAYYTGNQYLSNGDKTRNYWVMGLMGEKRWGKFSLYINFENFTDTRLTRFQSIYSGTIQNPQFVELYAPVEGFVTNAGIKIRL